MSGLLTDFRLALRSLGNSPLFVATAVLSLALGIGANATVFHLLDQVLLRLLPVKEANRIALLNWRGMFQGANTGSNALPYPLYKELRDTNQVFESLFCRYGFAVSLGFGPRNERGAAEVISGNYFEGLGVRPAMGRLIAPTDDVRVGGHPVLVLSHDFWTQRMNSDPNILGQKMLVNGQPFEIIGVSQAGFRGTELNFAPNVFVPAAMKAALSTGWTVNYHTENPRARWIQVYGRLRDGVTLNGAQASLAPLFASYLDRDLATLTNVDAFFRQQYLKGVLEVRPGGQGRDIMRREARTPLWAMMGMVGLLLLIACANVASLLTARAATKQKETAVRLALGAGKTRIVRQFFVESALIALAGGLAGLGLAVYSGEALLAMIPGDEAPNQLSATPDLRFVLFAFAVTGLTTLLFGMAPAFHAVGVDVAPALKQQTSSIAGGSLRLRKVLVATQIVLSLVLLIAAGLFLRTLRNLRNLDSGVETRQSLVFGVDPTQIGYSSERSQLLLGELLRELRAAPGARSAGLSMVRILSGDRWDNSMVVEGYTPQQSENVTAYFNAVSPGYFETLRIPMLSGRDFQDMDTASAAKVAIVNESFAKKFFAGQSPVGRHVGLGAGEEKPNLRVVGVIPDVHYEGLRETKPMQVFVPYAQASEFASEAHVHVRTAGDPAALFPAVRQIVSRLEPKLPVFQLSSMSIQVESILTAERMVSLLATVFGALAATLAATGLYGVLAFTVTRRTREIGLRMALGARSGQIVWLVLREVLVLLVAGAAIAIPVSLALADLVRTQLFGIEPHDPLTLVFAVLAMAAVALAAGIWPARRAARTDPMRALRYE